MNVEAVIWVYIIRGSRGKYYTGMTNDIARRMSEHKGGQSRSTKSYGDIELVWTKGFKDRKEARSMEVMIKKKGAKGWLKTYVGGSEESRREEEKEREASRKKGEEKERQ